MVGGVYLKAWRTALQTKLEYRADFVLGLLGSLGFQAASLAMLWTVLFHGGELAGWSAVQAALIFGLTAMVLGCSELFFNHIWYIPYYIVRGQMDRLLVYPVSTLPFFLLTSPELHAFGNIAGGLAIYTAAGLKLGLPLWAWLLLPYWVACGCLVHSSILTLCGALSFRVTGVQGYHLWATNQVLQSSRYPLGIYPLAYQWVLLTFLPFGAINYLPLSALLGKTPMIWAWLAPALAAGTIVPLTWKAWEAGLAHYESTGT